MANGRYGKVKVWAPGNYWEQPTRMQVYDGTNWIDFGLNDSDNTNQMSAYDPNTETYKPILQTKTVVHDYYYINGPFTLPMKTTGTKADYAMGNYCLNPNDNAGAKRAWNHRITCTMRRSENTDKLIFKNIDSNSSSSWNAVRTTNISSVTNGHQIIWRADGKIELKHKYNGNVYTITSTNAVTDLNTWVTLDIVYTHTTSAAYPVTITFNGVVTNYTGSNARYLGINKRHACGDTNLQFKGTFYIKMSSYVDNTEAASECTIDIENQTITPGNITPYLSPTYGEEYTEIWS